MADSDENDAALVANDENNAVVAAENDTQVENAQAPPQAPPMQGGGFWGICKTLLVRCLIMYAITSFLRRGTTPAPDSAQGGQALSSSIAAAHNVYTKEMSMDIYVYLSEEELFTGFDQKDALIWMLEDLSYGDWTSGLNGDGTYELKTQIQASEAVQNNGSLYLHTYFVRNGMSPNPDDKDNHDRRATVYKGKRLNKFKKRKFHDSVNLLTGQTEAHPDLIRHSNKTTVEIVNTWHSNLTINFVEDYTPWTRGSVPAPLNEFIEFVPGSPNYKPILFYNDYWNLNQDYMPINETTPVLNLTILYQPMSLFKWQMYAAQTMRNKWYASFLGEDVMGEESDEEQDSLKQTLVETNPYLLGLTIVVSLVHSVFEFLAFKNDIQFWRNRKSLEGLSVRSVFFNVFQSVVIVLYVMDNETNFVVRISVCIGLLIEIWKIFKVIDFKFDRENTIFGLPRPTFSDKSTYVESDTRKYDKLAFRYLSWLLYPLLLAYAIYSMIYQEHKGWYSWILNLLYGFLLTFGFIMMTPQLFINYKLKSVAHLPWRMLTYKALNTFIDDLFAFVIKMPILYRIGCFRDDIIFLIFLYQRYIYPVDKRRVNEYGTSQEMLEGDAIQNGTPPVAAIEAAAPEAEPVSSDSSSKTNSPKQRKPKNKKAKKND